MDAVVAHSAQAMAKGSTSFRMASSLFGRELREDVWRLYAWCRYCDDVIDGQDHGGRSVMLTDAERQARLEELRRLTHLAASGQPVQEPPFVALQQVALRHGLPESWLQELLDGFAMDVDGRRYESQADMLAYCWGVAGVVGVMMAKVMGAQDGVDVLRRAQDLGLAFQITNICRDIREDAENGRVYLPLNALQGESLPPTPAELLDQAHRPALFRIVQAQLGLAERYYDSARIGLRALPFRAAVAVAVAREVYRGIGRRLLSGGPSALASRTSVPKPAMALLALRGLGVALYSRLESRRQVPARPALWSRL